VPFRIETKFPGARPVDLGGGFVVVSPVTLIVEDEPDVPYDLRIKVVVDDGRFVVNELTASRKPGGGPVTTEQLRLVSVAKLVGRAMAAELDQVTQLSPTAVAIRGAGDQGDELSRIAALYRQALVCGLHPVQHVAERLEMPKSTAAKRVIAAREAGLLGATTPGKAGETA
jgi:hypothetical protein